jgi:enoyl-CoA hydratase
MCLALGADIRIAAQSAYFRNAGINNGLTGTEMGIGYLLPRAIGSSRAFEIILSGRDVDADEASRIGLVSRTVPDGELLPECLALAERLCGFSTQGIQLTKRALWAELEAASLEAAIELEDRNQLFIRLTTNNLDEAIRARREQRAPNFVD